ncbi:non-ribosomal peptide synthetase/type I polyketide synthase [Variovorax saccharolyticus]|uniref:non-ribosomal peptide synthetase/type I polyketide synthase n=1 Tax=Variovorax saccharolyticus TaxID=3053516 RepID=UPI0025784B68|nr:non-ribosomal peptide synthetase/type I polyketide synthase [Variovorax sp. J31P216]MDM0024745.1 amino acid adenylation domain-containing protein [Variovorax sp. J31P216]
MEHHAPPPFDAESAVAAGPEMQGHVDYWLSRFAGSSLPVLELPLDHPRPAVRTFNSRRIDRLLDQALVDALRKTGGASGASLFATLFTAFAATLHRLSAQDDLVVGIADLLPIRVAVEGRTPFDALLRQSAGHLHDAFEHRSLSYAALLDQLPVPRDPSRLPLVSVLFDAATDVGDLPGPKAAPSSGDFDLFLQLVAVPGGLQMQARYNADLYDDASVRRWLDMYECLLRCVTTDPRQPVGKLDVLSDAEAGHLVALQPAATPLHGQALMHAGFVERAALAAERPALNDGSRRWSYRELDEQSNRLAHALRERGVARGQRVGLCLERNADMMVALLAVLKAGAAYVPLDPGFPKARLDYYAEDAALSLLLTGSDVTVAPTSWCADAARRVFALDRETAWLDQPSTALAPSPQDALPEDAAYVIYTSGSTGKPKGVCVPHRAVANFLQSMREVPGISADDRLAAVTTLSFDIAVLELMLPLTAGAEVILVPRETTMDGEALRKLVEDSGATMMQATPSGWRLLLDAQWRGTPAFKALVGGEGLPPDLAQSLLQRCGELWNMYGPTETTIWSTLWRVDPVQVAQRGVSIGQPIANTTVWILDSNGQRCPIGVPGEIVIGGVGVTLGYLERPELTAERFVPDPWGSPGATLYRTGDRGRWRNDGLLEHMGRFDFQVKVRGYRIELGEIEARCNEAPGVASSVVLAREDRPGDVRLVAYLAMTPGAVYDRSALRELLHSRLPQYMVPQHVVVLPALPLLPNGKIDRKALPEPDTGRPELSVPYEEARTPAEARICAAFAKALGIDQVGRADNFFDLGGDSLLVMSVLADLQSSTDQRLTPNLFFQQPTPQALALELEGDAQARALPQRQPPATAGRDQEPIALIAVAGRFPGAADVEQFWDNLCAGRDSISFFDDATLDAGVNAALRANPNYVPARGVIDDVEWFDAAFFGMSPKEAQLMDPQQRLFLEVCWECIERAGYVPDRYPGSVGVYAGMHTATYFLEHLQRQPEMVEEFGALQVLFANEKDYIATRVAHRLNLTGPAIAIHTACSTSLVAVAQAFHALRSGQCDVALAGGIAITCPPRSGYLHEEGAMFSPDGHTRSFDAKAQGTVFSDGAGVVMLKRLSDALADGDPVYAVLRGVAVNNDGGAKASFTAPNIDGQAAVISAALASAGVDARSISYVETHGTATPMGDPVEIEGLRRAYARETPDTGFCRIGSVKSNVGHLVTAAGAAGLIKTALSLHHGQIPASIHFEAPNPAIDFEATPFRVNDRLQAWPRGDTPRRAGVSSFGVGGTNAHVIVEEAPLRAASDPSAAPQLLLLSARSPAALAMARQRLADHLDAHPGLSLPDVAHTLRVGRKAFAHRACVVAGDAVAAAAALRSDSAASATGSTGARVPQPVLMFPGQGAQYAGMGRELHASDAVFRAAFDECLAAFEGVLDFDLRERMFSTDDTALAPTSVTQPATFVLEYAIARRILALQVKPVALIGHSVGEFAAAVLAGVMRLEDAARLVARRGALMQAQPAGAMLSVRLSATELQPLLGADVSLAAENGPTACVASGPFEAIESLRTRLEANGVAVRLLQTSHAFHSAMMDAAVPAFEALVRELALSAPRLPIYSTLTGAVLAADEAVDPRYWARHLRETVRFSTALRAVLNDTASPVFIEAGPRNTLSTLARQHATKAQPAPAVELLGDRPGAESGGWRLAAGRLWTLGAEIDLGALDERTVKHRVLLPTYPFERKRFWVDIDAGAPLAAPAATAAPAVAPDPTSHSIPELPMTATAAAPARRAALDLRLRELFENLSGMEMSGVAGNAPFVEIGLDSLTLTQASIQVKKHFKANLTFRQLMESYRSFDALAEYLDATLPPEPAPAAPSIAAPVAAPAQAAAPAMARPPLQAAMAVPVGFASAAETGTLVQQVIAQQMQLMQQQLALLSAAPSIPASPVLPAPVVEQTTPLATAAATASTPTEPDAEEPLAAPKYDVKKAFGAIARIHTQSKEPTERQKARLAAFIRRYTERTAKSKAFTEHNRPHMADPRVVNGFRPATKEITYQIVIERSKGSRMWDLDGNEYVDVLSGFGMNLFGWQPDFILDAMRTQLDAGFEIGPQHPLAADVTQSICEMTGFERAGLCNTGSEAVMAAIRIARTATGRSTVAVFTGSYHGTFDEVLVRAGRSHKGMSAAPGVMQGMFGDIRVLDYGTPEALEFIRDNAEDLAAVLVEPVQSRRPDFQPREFLREVRAITEKSETCLIFDEVITGFRCHVGGAQAVFGVRADLACYGKVIGGGLPVGVIAGKRAYMDALDGGAWQYGDDSVPSVGVTYFAGTFVRHPLGLAAAKAALDHLKKDNNKLQTQLNLHTAAMADELSAFCREVGAPVEIRYFSSLWRVTWLEDHPLQDLLFAMMRSRGVHILDNFPCFMTTAHTQQDIATIKSAFKESIAEMQEAELLPRRAAGRSDLDPSQPPVPNARLGRDRDGQPAWFVPDPAAQGKYTRFQA